MTADYDAMPLHDLDDRVRDLQADISEKRYALTALENDLRFAHRALERKLKRPAGNA